MELSFYIYLICFLGPPGAVGVYVIYDYICEAKKDGNWLP